MLKTITRVTLLLVFASSISLSASPFIKDELLKPQARELIVKMAGELEEKTGIHGYVIATNDEMPKGMSMVTYVKQFESNISKPYVIYIFAPKSLRVGVLASSPEIEKLYDPDDVKDESINVVRDEYDGNKVEDKYNIAIIQSFSELVDQIGKSKNIEMTTVMPNDTHFVINIIRFFLYIGSIFVIWIFLVKPFINRIRNGKK